MDVLGKWRETDLSSRPGQFNFQLSAQLTTTEVNLDQIMVVGVSHAVGAPDPTPPPQGKVAVCHKGKKTLYLPKPAVRAHLRHGDIEGSCEAPEPDGGSDKGKRGEKRAGKNRG